MYFPIVILYWYVFLIVILYFGMSWIDGFRRSIRFVRRFVLTFVTGLEACWLQDITRLGYEEIYGFVLCTADQEEKRAVTFAYVARGIGSSFETTLKYKQLLT